MSMSIVFPVIETFAPILPLIACVVVKPRKNWVKILVIYLVVYIPFIGFANFIPLFVTDNILVYAVINVFTFICFVLLINSFIGNEQLHNFSYILIIAVMLFATYNGTRPYGLKYYDSLTSSVCAVIMIVYCIYYYWLQIQHPKEFFIYRRPSFWIVTAIFIYWGGNFFLFTNYRDLCLHAEKKELLGFYNDSKELWNFTESIWIIDDFFILLTNILFTKAILCTRTKA